MYKMYIKRGTGAFFCHRCGSSGSWYDLKRELGDVPKLQRPAQPARAPVEATRKLGSPPRFSGDSVSTAHTALCHKNGFPDVLQYLTQQRGLKRSTLEHYGVGGVQWSFMQEGKWQPHQCVVFPSLAPASHSDGCLRSELGGTTWAFAKAKLRSITDKRCMQSQPTAAAGGQPGLFGLHTLPPGCKEVVVTEGELDAMSVWQATGLPAVSLPNGANSLPPELLPLFEPFERITLWMDADAAGSAGVQRVLHKLGRGRCLVVQAPSASDGTPLKDANDALRAGADLGEVLAGATPCNHDQVLTLADLAGEVAAEVFAPPHRTGAEYTSLPPLTDATHGFRTGELTVLTGPTGSGKTTLLSQLSLDLAEAGIASMWGSFEIPVPRLVKTMLRQRYGGEVLADKAAFRAAMEELSGLPLFFLRYYGSTEVGAVLDAMDYVVYRHDVSHILLDNLQFMMAARMMGAGVADKFDAQDRALDAFRQFASSRNVSVSVVIHPRKEPSGSSLSLSSVFGSAKATQEADNVWILQVGSDGAKSLDIKKNRYAGTLGSTALKYHGASGRFFAPGFDPELLPIPQPLPPQPTAPTTTYADSMVTAVDDAALAADISTALEEQLAALPASPPQHKPAASRWPDADIVAE